MLILLSVPRDMLVPPHNSYSTECLGVYCSANSDCAEIPAGRLTSGSSIWVDIIGLLGREGMQAVECTPKNEVFESNPSITGRVGVRA